MTTITNIDLETLACDKTYARAIERARRQLRALGYRLSYSSREEGFIIYSWAESARCWMFYDGQTPVPYSLSLGGVLQHIAEIRAEIEAEHAAEAKKAAGKRRAQLRVVT